MSNIFMEGFLLQASLIFALGAQNLFVLESGLNREHPIAVSFTCFLCDLTLIMLGVAGAATLITQYHQLKIIFGVLGIVFMFCYGLSKLFSRPQVIEGNQHRANTLKKSILLSITFSILNPHAYLDAFVLIGGYSTKYGDLTLRVMIGLGAACFSLVWFLFLSSASSIMKPFMECPRRMRIVMSTSGFVLIVLAGKLSTDVYSWLVQMLDDPHCSVFGSCAPNSFGNLLPQLMVDFRGR